MYDKYLFYFNKLSFFSAQVMISILAQGLFYKDAVHIYSF